MSDKRPLPRFFTEWRSDWIAAAPFVPTDYLNQQELLPGVIMAGWLFCPTLVEYRGGIFLEERFESGNVDSWLERFDGDIASTEEMINRIALGDVFSDCSLNDVDDALPGLATTIACCWQGVIQLAYPDRTPVVTTDAAADFGPTITFRTAE